MYNPLFQDAVSGLTEYYPFLMDESLAGEFESCIKYPDSGNNQLDYENVRDQLEKLCRQYESKIVKHENDVMEAIQFRLNSLHEMGYKMTDQFVAQLIAKYCVDVAATIAHDTQTPLLRFERLLGPS